MFSGVAEQIDGADRWNTSQLSVKEQKGKIEAKVAVSRKVLWKRLYAFICQNSVWKVQHATEDLYISKDEGYNVLQIIPGCPREGRVQHNFQFLRPFTLCVWFRLAIC